MPVTREFISPKNCFTGYLEHLTPVEVKGYFIAWFLLLKLVQVYSNNFELFACNEDGE